MLGPLHLSGIDRPKVALLLAVHKAARAHKRPLAAPRRIREPKALKPQFSSVIAARAVGIRRTGAAPAI